MEYYIGDTAKFLVGLFFCSRYSLQYKLEATDLSIVRYIADSIDLSFALYGKKSSLLSYNQIAQYARCSPKTVQRCISKIKKYHILKVDKNKGWKYKFSIGSMLTAYAQRNRKLPTTQVTSKKNPGHHDLPYNSSSIKTNNKRIFKNVKKINKENHAPENGLQALKQLKNKLIEEGKIK